MDERLENPTVNKSFRIFFWWISETRQLVFTSCLIWSLIWSLQIRQSGRGEMLDVYIHKTINKLTLKRKTTKARINAKKVITRLCNVCVKLGSVKKLIVYQNSRLSTFPTFNMIKVNQYDNQGKISRTWSKICESKK